MTATYDGWGLTDSDYEPRLTHGMPMGDEWAACSGTTAADRIAHLAIGNLTGSVYDGDGVAVVYWTDNVANDWAEAYTGTNRVAVAVARLAVLALPAIHGHGFVDDADGFAARVEPVLLESVGLGAEFACPECRGAGGACDYDEFGCVDGWLR